ncbi:MAG: hypothetical protein COW56_02130 [Rhodocyclales bacterium CG17_big_fil_post_rev_8_21_14_2_50_68_7]|nr:MAG: hypothetical protein COW56_02130 [Rhodocyclales bacterium CG17_big_fil_post_rev_8_21_14_2_50_68_7]
MYTIILIIVVYYYVRLGLWLMRRARDRCADRKARWIVGTAVGLVWFGLLFWYGGGRKYYYDWQVEKLCAKDGGVKVYETVRLPAERFDKFGMVKLYSEQRVENKSAYRHNDKQTVLEEVLGQEYIYRWITTYYRKGSPDMFRMHFQVIRLSDGKLLGESFFYKRGGGDLPGPWHGSSYMCPELSVANDVLRQVFVKE